MFLNCLKLCIAVMLVFDLIMDASSKLTPNQHSRIRESYINKKIEDMSIYDKKGRELFEIIYSRDENVDIEMEACKSKELKLPDFRAPGLRTSEIKCLEHLWKIRYYDQSLISAVLCPTEQRDSISSHLSLLNLNFGGLDGVANDYPHMGAIGWQTKNDTWLFMCEGALISEKHMLTSAGCTNLSTPNERVSDLTPKIVRFGVRDISEKEEIGKKVTDILIHKITVHPKYRSMNSYYDIAIIELEKEVVFSTQVHPACIWPGLDDVPSNAVLTGWNIVESSKTVNTKEFVNSGLDMYTRLTLAQKITPQDSFQNDTSHDPVMTMEEVFLTSSRNCRMLTKPRGGGDWQGILFQHFCSLGPPCINSDTYQVDTGSVVQTPIEIPEFSDWRMHYVTGIKSFIFGCTQNLSLSVNTKTSVFLEWIEEIVWGTKETGNDTIV